MTMTSRVKINTRIGDTFMNRRNANDVLRVASEQAGREVKLFSDLLNKRVALSGLILGSPGADPSQQVIYVTQLAVILWAKHGSGLSGLLDNNGATLPIEMLGQTFRTDKQTDIDNMDQQNMQVYQMALERDFLAVVVQVHGRFSDHLHKNGETPMCVQLLCV